MRVPVLVLAVLGATPPVAPADPPKAVTAPRQEQANESARKIKALQKERIATLKELAEQSARLFQNGKGSVEALLEAQVQVCEAELDAAEKEADRVSILENLVGVLKRYETFAAERVKAARGTMAAVLKVKARRLDAEIKLERARVKAAGKGK